MERFAEKLRVLRQKLGFSQTQLGNLLGVKQSYIGKMERGERIPNVAMLIKLTKIFDVTFDELMDDDLDLIE